MWMLVGGVTTMYRIYYVLHRVVKCTVAFGEIHLAQLAKTVHELGGTIQRIEEIYN